jgi:hypothetical protein
MPVHYKGMKATHVGLRVPLEMLSVRLFECAALCLRCVETAQNPTRTRSPLQRKLLVQERESLLTNYTSGRGPTAISPVFRRRLSSTRDPNSADLLPAFSAQLTHPTYFASIVHFAA